MNPEQRIVVRLPLENLWNSKGPPNATKKQELTENDLKALLSNHLVLFVIAEAGLPLIWISREDCYEFWKAELQSHLFHPEQRHLEDYPDGYFYVAHLWMVQDDEQIVVLEKHH